MSGTKVSAFTAASALDGTEVLGGVQGGNSRKVSVDQIKTYIAAVTSVGVTAPIATTGGLTPTISITAATKSAAGSQSAIHFDRVTNDDYLSIVERAEFWTTGDYTTSVAGTGTNALSSGASTNGGIVSGRGGIVQHRVVTTATSDRACMWACYGKAAAAYTSTGAGAIRQSFQISIDQLSDATDEFYFCVGSSDLATAEPANGIYVVYDRAGIGVNWTLKSAAASTRSTATGGSTVPVTAAWHTIEIVLNAGGTSAEAFIDGVSIGTVTTNLPTAANTFPGHVQMRKTAGTLTARTVRTDHISIETLLTTTRGY